MNIRVIFEIGHEASLRTKRTPEGFTHDWEVFVRGCDGADIHYFIEKVVFYLHDTFPKPKRVIKEPPYKVKESGYAGFVLPIEIYLQNKYEPKKIKFNYDLNLQPAGPPMVRVQNEKYVFEAPNDEFKSKLLKGGGTILNSSGSHESSDTRSVSDDKGQLISKPKLGGSDITKKHKIKTETPDFLDLFGVPITKTSKAPEQKQPTKDVNKSSSSSSTSTKPDKDKEKDKNKSKYSPSKEKDKERERDKSKDKGDSDRKSKEEKKNRDRNKERDRSKEKSAKKDKSPRPPSPKRSPLRSSSPKRPLSPSSKHKDDKRDKDIKDKDRRSAEEKSDKKSKKDKRDRDKDHKENKHKEKDIQKSSEFKEYKSKEVKPNKESIKEKEPSPPPPPPPIPPLKEKKDKSKEKDHKEPKGQMKEQKDLELISEKIEKSKSEKSEEKQKHKHKKKDKDRKDKREDKDKSHKSEKKSDKVNISTKKYTEPIKEEKTNSSFSSPKSEPAEVKPKISKPLALLAEVDNESSNSSISSVDTSFVEPTIEKIEEKPEPVIEPKKVKTEVETPPPPLKVKKEKSKKKDKKTEKDSEKRRKRKSDPIEEAPQEKLIREAIPMDTSIIHSDEDQNSSVQPTQETEKEMPEKPEDYMSILKDLQHKIMSLQDNTELQKVVQLIVQTGRYEVSSCTFDFDLCLLERSTVQQLQEFFASSS